MWAQLLGQFAGLAGGGGAPMPADQISPTAANSFQAGSLTIGAKQVGGTGNQAGATSAAQSQTPLNPFSEVPAAVAGSAPLPSWLPWVIVAGIVGLVAVVLRRS
jgi:hypothetical protein